MASPGGKSLADLKKSGTYQANPGRYKGRLDGKQPHDPPLGDAPKHLDFAEAACWLMFRDEMPWLTKSDATLVEMACKLRAKLMLNTLDMKSGYGALGRLITQLAGTPLSRDRMRAKPDDEDEDGNGDLFS
jgi:hypothetical protein